ncbi:hypothetical protein R1flu_005016 [Riccia fluitans]|uniref:Uncharacterized protein n=1 Tax=Riccia fluitans TaxID=41844 RepID=A0ABD1YUY7_9MARC
MRGVEAIIAQDVVLAGTLCPNCPTILKILEISKISKLPQTILECPRLDESTVCSYLRAPTSREPIRGDGTSLNSAWSSGMGARSYRGSERRGKKKHTDLTRKVHDPA